MWGEQNIFSYACELRNFSSNVYVCVCVCNMQHVSSGIDARPMASGVCVVPPFATPTTTTTRHSRRGSATPHQWCGEKSGRPCCSWTGMPGGLKTLIWPRIRETQMNKEQMIGSSISPEMDVGRHM